MGIGTWITMTKNGKRTTKMIILIWIRRKELKQKDAEKEKYLMLIKNIKRMIKERNIPNSNIVSIR